MTGIEPPTRSGRSHRRPPRRRRPPLGGAVLASLAFAGLGTCLCSVGEAQTPYGATAAGEPPLPFGLAMIWRREEYRLAHNLLSRTTGAFALDGRLYAVRNDTGIRVLDVADGTVVKRWPALDQQDAFSFAVSSNGQIAIGRAGRLEVSGPGPDQRARHYPCTDACGPVQDVAFSPDGSLLAYQGARGLRDRQRGLGYAVVLEARTGRAVARLEAIAARAHVAFSPDGEKLIAAHATSFDETETFGIRAWRTSDWELTHHLPGTTERWRGIGRLAGSDFAAAYERDGRLEIRDLMTGLALWSVPLVAPTLDTEASEQVRLALVELAPNGAFVLSYETPRLLDPGNSRSGTLVIRAAGDGEVLALYDVPGVTDVAIAPDGRSFAYSTRAGETYTVLARVPL